MGERSVHSLLDGRYALVRPIGRGGMGEVWAARDERLDRTVAVKLLHPEVAARREVRQRFEAEARAAARLGHSRAVAVYDTGEDRGRAYIVMECLTGLSLADELTAGPLPAAEVTAMARDVLGALAAAHRAGIVHRDVKPANILRDADGSWKLADFGIAKAAESADLTTTGLLLGTPAYLAPERVDGQPAAPASDVYSLGVVMYEALSGDRAFPGSDPLAVALQVKLGQVAPLARPGSAPPGLVGLIERAMDRDPGRRYPDAAAMALALAGVTGSDRGAGWEATTGSDGIGDTAAAATTAVLPLDGAPDASAPTVVATPAAPGAVRPWSDPAATRDPAARPGGAVPRRWPLLAAALPPFFRRWRRPAALVPAAAILLVVLVAAALLAGWGGGAAPVSRRTPPPPVTTTTTTLAPVVLAPAPAPPKGHHPGPGPGPKHGHAPPPPGPDG